ncbi:MAG: hypothetical protein JNM27_11570 [Leptospirales bacterium]|nr:hypothetical protein [Leptospirales bacterium]
MREALIALQPNARAASILSALDGDVRCSICSRLARVESWNHELSTPREAKKLSELGNLRICPECSNLYQFSYSSESEDNHTRESFELERLHPGQALKKLQGESATDYKTRLPELICDLKAGTDHPDDWICSESAWKLAEYFLSTGEWPEIERLAAKDATCMRETVMAIAVAVRGGLDPNPLQGTAERALQSELCQTKGDAAFVLSWLILQGQNHDEVKRYLFSSDSCILYGCLRAIQARITMGMRCPHLDRIAALTLHEQDNVRSFAHFIVEAAAENGQSVPFLVPDLILSLHSQSPAVRSDGLRALKNTVTKENAASILAGAARLVNDPECSGALELVEACAAAGASLEALTDQFISELNPHSRGELLRLLAAAARQNPEKVGRAAKEVAGECLNEAQLVPAASHLLEFLSNAKCDLTAAIPAVQSFVQRAVSTDSYTESLIQVLLRHWTGITNFEEISRLLSHKTTTIRLSALYRIRDLLAEGLNFRPVLASLRELLKDPSQRVREMAEETVAQIKE